HGYALQNINRHLEKHHSIAAKERKAIVRKYAQYPLLEPSHVPLPLPLGPRLEVLGEPIDAFLCEEEKCGFVSVNRSVIGQHCNKKHDWESTKENRESWSKVKVQTFFATGGLQRYFTVHVAPDQAADPLVSVEDDADVTRILDECRRAKEEHDREMEKADEMVARTDRTGWFNRTGWPEHLARRNLVHLSHASRMPDRGERLLHQAVKIVDLVIEKSVAGLSSLAIETRRWLKSAKREEASRDHRTFLLQIDPFRRAIPVSKSGDTRPCLERRSSFVPSCRTFYAFRNATSQLRANILSVSKPRSTSGESSRVITPATFIPSPTWNETCQTQN
ncbi:hypothetical protein LTR28_008209, partial [Elasticomyces elasticus]